MDKGLLAVLFFYIARPAPSHRPQIFQHIFNCRLGWRSLGADGDLRYAGVVGAALGGEIGLQLRVIWAFHNRAGIGGEFGGVVVIHQHHPIAGSLNVACAVGGEGVALGVGVGAVLQRLGGFVCPFGHKFAAGIKMANQLKMGVVTKHGVVAGDALQACDVFGLPPLAEKRRKS